MEKWQLDALNFEVKAIETFLGLQFEGETVEEKQAFVAAHHDKRTEVTSDLLSRAYEEHVNNPACDMKIYVMSEDNYILHYSWEDALTYYTALVGQDTFDDQKDDLTGSEIEPSQFTVVIEYEEGSMRGTVQEFIDKREILGVEYFAVQY